MKHAVCLALMALAITGCVSKEHTAWLEELKTSRENWHACAMTATEQYSKQYSDPDMIARYALHVCEPKKDAYIEVHLRNSATIRDKFFEMVEKDETRLRERMQMFATKWLADRAAILAQDPVPLEFGTSR